MNKNALYENIKQALKQAPKGGYCAEMHLQMIKYTNELADIDSKEFCRIVGLKKSYAAELRKMRKLLPRLKRAGLNTELI